MNSRILYAMALFGLKCRHNRMKTIAIYLVVFLIIPGKYCDVK